MQRTFTRPRVTPKDDQRMNQQPARARQAGSHGEEQEGKSYSKRSGFSKEGASGNPISLLSAPEHWCSVDLLQEGLLELVINCFLLKGVVNSHLPSNFDRISWEWRAKGFYNLKFALLQRGHEKMFFSPSVEMPRIHLQRTLHGMPEAGGSQSPGGGAERALLPVSGAC